jgi:hypothetical protein
MLATRAREREEHERHAVRAGRGHDHVEDALAEYEAINVAHNHVGSTHDFDANVIAKGANGSVEIVRRHDAGKSHGAETLSATQLAEEMR